MLDEMGEDTYYLVQFLSEPKKSVVVMLRSSVEGLTTTHNRSKITACAKFKQWVETDKIEDCRSKNLLGETKNVY